MFVAKCVLGLLLMQMPTVWNHAAYQNKKASNEELMLQMHRLEAKVDAALDIQRSMKLRFEADRSLQKAELSDTISSCRSDLRNATVTWSAEIADQRNSLEAAKARWNGSRGEAYFFAKKLSGEGVSSGSKVVFDSLRSQTPSNSYSTSTGIYRCPYDGTYVFVATIFGQYNYGNRYYQFEIQKEGTTLATVYGYVTSGENYYETMSATGVARCNKGDSVWVKNAGNINYVNARSHFTGFKIV